MLCWAYCWRWSVLGPKEGKMTNEEKAARLEEIAQYYLRIGELEAERLVRLKTLKRRIAKGKVILEERHD